MADQELGTFLAAVCRRHRGRPAVRSGSRTATYDELFDRAVRLANGLRGLGVQPGGRVALMVENRIEALEAYIGCFLAGVVAVHVNDRLLAREVAHILGDSRAEVLIHTDGRTPVIEQLEKTGLRAVVTIGDQVARGARSYEDLIGSADGIYAPVARSGSDVAVVGYTSGTTGFPKGAVLTHSGIISCIRLIPMVYNLTPYGRCAYTGTFSFISGLWGIHLPHLYVGASIDLLHPYTIESWVEHVRRERCTFTNMPSPLADGLLEALEKDPHAFDGVRTVMHAGSPLRRDQVVALVDRLGDRFVEVWGMTESGGPITATVPGDWRGAPTPDVFRSVGRAVATASIRVVDALGQVSPVGEGQLQVRADTLFAGYLGNEEATSAALQNGWLSTGDLGRIDAEGYVYLDGRASDLVISGGMNVYPAEVEAALCGHPAVRDAVVLGLPDPKWGEAVVAVVVAKGGADPAEEELIAYVRGMLASYKKPQRVFFWNELPRNASQKINKRLIRERLIEPLEQGEAR
jgi:acyl-CoA synthetase (AMP-forming)/AMP-acid ligase II